VTLFHLGNLIPGRSSLVFVVVVEGRAGEEGYFFLISWSQDFSRGLSDGIESHVKHNPQIQMNTNVQQRIPSQN
jgi:hypothetical protein